MCLGLTFSLLFLLCFLFLFIALFSNVLLCLRTGKHHLQYLIKYLKICRDIDPDRLAICFAVFFYLTNTLWFCLFTEENMLSRHRRGAPTWRDRSTRRERTQPQILRKLGSRDKNPQIRRRRPSMQRHTQPTKQVAQEVTDILSGGSQGSGQSSSDRSVTGQIIAQTRDRIASQTAPWTRRRPGSRTSHRRRVMRYKKRMSNDADRTSTRKFISIPRNNPGDVILQGSITDQIIDQSATHLREPTKQQRSWLKIRSRQRNDREKTSQLQKSGDRVLSRRRHVTAQGFPNKERSWRGRQGRRFISSRTIESIPLDKNVARRESSMTEPQILGGEKQFGRKIEKPILGIDRRFNERVANNQKSVSHILPNNAKTSPNIDESVAGFSKKVFQTKHKAETQLLTVPGVLPITEKDLGHSDQSLPRNFPLKTMKEESRWPKRRGRKMKPSERIDLRSFDKSISRQEVGLVELPSVHAPQVGRSDISTFNDKSITSQIIDQSKSHLSTEPRNRFFSKPTKQVEPWSEKQSQQPKHAAKPFRDRSPFVQNSRSGKGLEPATEQITPTFVQGPPKNLLKMDRKWGGRKGQMTKDRRTVRQETGIIQRPFHQTERKFDTHRNVPQNVQGNGGTLQETSLTGQIFDKSTARLRTIDISGQQSKQFRSWDEGKTRQNQAIGSHFPTLDRNPLLQSPRKEIVSATVQIIDRSVEHTSPNQRPIKPITTRKRWRGRKSRIIKTTGTDAIFSQDGSKPQQEAGTVISSALKRVRSFVSSRNAPQSVHGDGTTLQETPIAGHIIGQSPTHLHTDSFLGPPSKQDRRMRTEQFKQAALDSRQRLQKPALEPLSVTGQIIDKRAEHSFPEGLFNKPLKTGQRWRGRKDELIKNTMKSIDSSLDGSKSKQDMSIFAPHSRGTTRKFPTGGNVLQHVHGDGTFLDKTLIQGPIIDQTTAHLPRVDFPDKKLKRERLRSKEQIKQTKGAANKFRQLDSRPLMQDPDHKNMAVAGHNIDQTLEQISPQDSSINPLKTRKDWHGRKSRVIKRTDKSNDISQHGSTTQQKHGGMIGPAFLGAERKFTQIGNITPKVQAGVGVLQDTSIIDQVIDKSSTQFRQGGLTEQAPKHLGRWDKETNQRTKGFRVLDRSPLLRDPRKGILPVRGPTVDQSVQHVIPQRLLQKDKKNNMIGMTEQAISISQDRGVVQQDMGIISPHSLRTEGKLVINKNIPQFVHGEGTTLHDASRTDQMVDQSSVQSHTRGLLGTLFQQERPWTGHKSQKHEGAVNQFHSLDNSPRIQDPSKGIISNTRPIIDPSVQHANTQRLTLKQLKMRQKLRGRKNASIKLTEQNIDIFRDGSTAHQELALLGSSNNQKGRHLATSNIPQFVHGDGPTPEKTSIVDHIIDQPPAPSHIDDFLGQPSNQVGGLSKEHIQTEGVVNKFDAIDSSPLAQDHAHERIPVTGRIIDPTLKQTRTLGLPSKTHTSGKRRNERIGGLLKLTGKGAGVLEQSRHQQNSDIIAPSFLGTDRSATSGKFSQLVHGDGASLQETSITDQIIGQATEQFPTSGFLSEPSKQVRPLPGKTIQQTKNVANKFSSLDRSPLIQDAVHEPLSVTGQIVDQGVDQSAPKSSSMKRQKKGKRRRGRKDRRRKMPNKVVGVPLDGDTAQLGTGKIKI